MSVLDKMKKRRCYPISLGDEKIHVRAMTLSELTRIDAIDADNRTGFMLGCCLVSDDGNPEFTKRPADGDQPAEDDNAFGKRVMDAMVDVDPPTIRAAIDGIAKVGTVDAETLTNFSETTTKASSAENSDSPSADGTGGN